MDSLKELETYYAKHGDQPATHQFLLDYMIEQTNADPHLFQHLRSTSGYCSPQFATMWRWIIESLPNGFAAMEIGVNTGQVIALWESLASRQNKNCLIVGVSTFDGRDVVPGADCYRSTLETFNRLNLAHPLLIKGDSTDKLTIEEAARNKPYDVIFIDGGHAFEIATSDILNYAPMLKVGGLLVIDDSSNRMHMPPSTPTHHFFQGIESVSQAVDALLPPLGSGVLPDGSSYNHIVAVMHDRIFRRMS